MVFTDIVIIPVLTSSTSPRTNFVQKASDKVGGFLVTKLECAERSEVQMKFVQKNLVMQDVILHRLSLCG